ncbi:unnamed protein product [Echinostoma caproni]|uniref:LHFPL tetraspan subfamily member 4b n=1 Tax=Echinostoma caproni TaxID=27848 RepID=A0A183ANN2_9TREM|nr:unnamed protein product [Echinostoma caproni]
MPRIILSWVALLWIILSVISTVIILTGLFTSSWLRRIETDESRRFTECPISFYPSLVFPIDSGAIRTIPSRGGVSDSPSIGPWLRCQMSCVASRNEWSFTWRTPGANQIMRCQLALHGFGERPAPANALVWTAASLCLVGSILLVIATLMVLSSICKRNICDRSVHSCTGAIQGLSGELVSE